MDLAGLDRQLNQFVLHGPAWPLGLGAGLAGAAVGAAVHAWCRRLLARYADPAAGNAAERLPSWTLVALLGAGLFAALTLAVAKGRCQEVVENGSIDLLHWRIVFHMALASLLLAAWLTDLADYLVPDEITLPGILLGVTAAAVGGNLQLVPLWIDWNDPLAPMLGGRIPEWIRAHDHLHGLAWSAAGLAAGAGGLWLVRALSSWLLGEETMGFGDVTLMGLIGSFVGWQAVVFVVALAPLCGFLLGLATWIWTGRTFVAFGPYLCAAALLVLFTWRWLWLQTRTHFGDPATLGLLTGIACVALVICLGLLRISRGAAVGRPR